MRVSVVLPTFNHQRYIGEALHSVFVQDVDGLEIIVIDDGSSDHTAALAEGLLERRAIPYRVIRQQNLGAHAAFNAGLSLARGEYISLLNSDDRYVPGRLRTLLERAQQTKRRFLVTRLRHIDEGGNPLPDTAPHPYYYARSLNALPRFPTPGFEWLRHNYACTTGNFFFHRSLVAQVGPFREYKICHDWDYALRALLVEDITWVDTVLYEYRIHPANTIRPSLHELRYAEVDDVVADYLRQAESASNSLAPCFKNWGAYWQYFAGAELVHLAHLPKIAGRLDEIARASSARGTFSLEKANQELLIEALANNAQRVRALEADVQTYGETIGRRAAEVEDLRRRHDELERALAELRTREVTRLSGEEIARSIGLRRIVQALAFRLASRPGLTWLRALRPLAKRLLGG